MNLEKKNKIAIFSKYLCVIACVVLLDQISKLLIVKYIPIWTEGPLLIGEDFLRFTHIRNKAAGFGLGNSLTGFWRILFIIIIPCALMAYLIYLLYNSEKINITSKLEKVSLCLIVGGGLGNLIDRIFRVDGVVDFIDIKFYGIFGFERWPAFNMADSCVVVGAILLIISMIFHKRKGVDK